MSTANPTTTDPQLTGSSPAQRVPARLPARDASLAVTFPRVLHSEWIKLRSVRSMIFTLLGAAVAVIGIGVLAAAVQSGDVTAPGPGGQGGPGFATDPTGVSLAGVQLGHLIVAIVGSRPV